MHNLPINQASDFNVCLVSSNTAKLQVPSCNHCIRETWCWFFLPYETPIGLMHVLYYSVWRKQCVAKAIDATHLSLLTSHFTIALNNMYYAVTAQFHSVWLWIWVSEKQVSAQWPEVRYTLALDRETILASYPALSFSVVWRFKHRGALVPAINFLSCKVDFWLPRAHKTKENHTGFYDWGNIVSAFFFPPSE